MSVELIETIKQQAAGLTPQEKSQLGRYFLEQAKSDDVEAAERRRRQHAEWLKAHREEYGGMYVALDGNRLIGTGRNYPEAAEAARRAGVRDAYVEFVLPPDYEGYMGG